MKGLTTKQSQVSSLTLLNNLTGATSAFINVLARKLGYFPASNLKPAKKENKIEKSVKNFHQESGRKERNVSYMDYNNKNHNNLSR